MELQETIKEEIKDKRVLGIIYNSIDIVKSLGYKIYNNIEFRWEDNKGVFGTCYIPTSENGNFIITLNKYLQNESEENIENTICHELAHYIVDMNNILSERLYFKNGKWFFSKKDYNKTKDSSHGSNWKEVASKISTKTRTPLKPSDTYETYKEVGKQYHQNSKYIVKCKECGNELYYDKRTSFVKDPNQKSKYGDWYVYKCPKCKAKGQFEVITNESLDEDLIETNIEDKVISLLRTLGYEIKFLDEGWYDEEGTLIDDWEEERDEPEDDWYYVETPYYLCKNNEAQVSFSWRINESTKSFTIVGIYGNYKGSIQGFATKTIEDVLEIIPQDWIIEISNCINTPYWNHMKKKHSQYRWEDIDESLDLKEQLRYNVSTSFDIECIEDDEEFMSLDKSYKQEYYKLLKEWNALNDEFSNLTKKLEKISDKEDYYIDHYKELSASTKEIVDKRREVNAQALEVWNKIEVAIERAKEQFNNDGESNIQVVVSSKNIDHYFEKYIVSMKDEEIIKICQCKVYDNVQEKIPMFLLPNGGIIGDFETHASFIESICDKVFTHLFEDRFVKDYDIYDCEVFLYMLTHKKGWARLNCGKLASENRFYCVLPEEVTRNQWYKIEDFLAWGESHGEKEILVYAGEHSDSYKYSYEYYTYEEILKRIKRYYSSGRFFEALNEQEDTFKFPTSNKSIVRASKDLEGLGYKLEKVSIEQLVKDNNLLDDKLFNYHTQDWGDNPSEYIFGNYEVQYWNYSDIMSCTYKGGKYILDNGKHRIRALYNQGYKYIEIYVLSDIKKINEQLLLEKTRAELLNKSKHADSYKDTSKGKNRYERRLKSKVANNVYQYNKIDMNDFFKKDILTIGIDVKGETNNYIVTMKFNGVLKEIQNEVKANKGKLEFKVISRAMSRKYNSDDVKLWCTCPDWCLKGDTNIKLLSGEVITIEELYNRVNQEGCDNIFVYSTDTKGDFKPGKVNDVWISGYTKDMVKVTLDNGKEIVTTPNHRYMLRDGSYIEAKNLCKGTSLMPLYFKVDSKGYEEVKFNSVCGTKFYSVYKQVANALLQEQIEEAKVRSGEENIAIHHKDFNKLNNSPSNLVPMGVQEHYKYHYEHVKESGVLDKFLQAGREYWAKQESRDKQAQVMRKVMREYFSSLSQEEYQKIKDKICTDEWRQKIGKSNMNVWKNYSKEEYARRCEINKQTNLKNKDKISTKVKEWHKNMSPEQRKEISEKMSLGIRKAWEEKRENFMTPKRKESDKRKGNKNFSIEDGRQINLSKIKNLINKILENGEIPSAETYEKYRTNGYPKFTKYFKDWEEVSKYFKLNHKVKSVEFIHYEKEIPVYDMNVDTYNNFYVDAGVILHNCYRQSFRATKGGYATQIELRPSDITNPHDTKGGGCKHALLVMSNLDWMMKVSSVIFNYIKYSQKNLEVNYANYIFPKIYGMPYNKALQLDLFDSGLLPSDQQTLTNIASTNLKNKDEKGRFIKGNEYRFKSNKPNEDEKGDDTYFNLEKDRKGKNVLTYPIDKNRNNLGRFIKGNQASKKPTSIKNTFGDEKKKEVVPNKEEGEK